MPQYEALVKLLGTGVPEGCKHCKTTVCEICEICLAKTHHHVRALHSGDVRRVTNSSRLLDIWQMQNEHRSTCHKGTDQRSTTWRQSCSPALNEQKNDLTSYSN